MTLAAFHAAVEGYVLAHAPKTAEDEIADDEFLLALGEEIAAGRA